jgi:hypothetical protein
MTDRNSNKESKVWLKAAAVMIRWKLCLYINLYKYFRHVRFFFILNLHQHLIYLLDLKTVDKVVYRRENSSVQAKIGHDELTKIRTGPVGTSDSSFFKQKITNHRIQCLTDRFLNLIFFNSLTLVFNFEFFQSNNIIHLWMKNKYSFLK